MATSLVNSYAKGRFIEKCMLPLGTDHILVVPIQSASIPSDTTLRTCSNLAAVFTAGALEATFSNYSRIPLTSSSITITTTLTGSFQQAASFTTQVWAGAGGAVNNTLAAILLAYQPTTGTADSGCLVLATLSYAGTTTGGALTAVLGTLTDT